MELIELHVLQRHTVPPCKRHAIARKRVCVGGDAPGAAVATSSKEHRLRAQHVHRAVRDLVADDTGTTSTLVRLATLEDEINDVIFVIELDARFDALLVERLQNHVPSAVCGVAAASNRAFTVVACMPAEAALIDLAVGGAIEWKAHALQFNHRGDRLTCEHFGRILVGEIVATLDGVEHVPLPVVLFHVAERRADAALRRTRVRSSWVELRQYRSGDPFACELKRCPEPGAAGAHDNSVDVDVRRVGAKTCAHFSGNVMMTWVPRATSTAVRV